MKNIRGFLSENFQFLEVKFSIYLNRRVFVMETTFCCIGSGLRLFAQVCLSLFLDYAITDLEFLC